MKKYTIELSRDGNTWNETVELEAPCEWNEYDAMDAASERFDHYYDHFRVTHDDGIFSCYHVDERSVYVWYNG